jgi:phosphoribosylaminoimidazolecarboxamide formyltransferase / IMP cyclohydrolase
MIRRAVLSVSDKSGLAELARFLVDRDVELISTGGTAKYLADLAIPVTPISSFTGAPEILGGRVKTLHPRVFGGILFDRGKEDHQRDVRDNGIGEIDLVVVNLYPFEETIRKEGVTLVEAIEQIDVGGPSMLRAAAKNHRDVVVLCTPDLYQPFMTEMESGTVSEAFRLRAAIEVFRTTTSYDAAIASFLSNDDRERDRSGQPDELPGEIQLTLRKLQSLRYGENPQQQAAFYELGRSTLEQLPAGGGHEQLQGKELSYNNLLDLDAAWRLASSLDDPACAIIKHTNPCGVAGAGDLETAVENALAADPVSAFGGIVAVNRSFTAGCVEKLGQTFLEVIVAPSFDQEALELLGRKKNLRLIRAGVFAPSYDLKSAAGGVLVQSADRFSEAEWRSVARREPSPEELEALRFAWIVCAHVKSNAIVIGRGRQSNGVGAGQMSRVDSARIAIMKSIHPTKGCVAASDAFFPFRDGLDLLAAAGITAIVQPGGSVRDEEVIAAADEHGLAMLFTGERHFRH